MKAAVVRFPGSNCDQDAHLALTQLGVPTDYVWHKDSTLGGADLVVVPGGFSYGDYLRCGAIARFSPIMKSVIDTAKQGGLVMGICNGFQILCEAGLLPGALIRNKNLHFVCEHVRVRVENYQTPWTCAAWTGTSLRIPVAHGEGSYVAEPETLKELNRNRQILLRYCDVRGAITESANPNGSTENIAGICNDRRNVFGLMPHPERACDARLGSTDGLVIFQSVLQHLGVKAAA